MNGTPTESGALGETELPGEGSWPRARWYSLILLLFAVQIGLIFALGDRKPSVPRPLAPGPGMRLMAGSGELLALYDPTLFALPHPNGFAGAAWMKMPQVDFASFQWSEPPRWLALPVEQLGGTFLNFLQTNSFARLELETWPAPQVNRPELPPGEIMSVMRTLPRAEGGLVARQWLNVSELSSVPSAELLTNSVVQVLVDAPGNIISATLLPPGSGSKAADQRALALAQAARFAPLNHGAAKLNLGALIFPWRTEPLAVTNAPAINPQP